MKGFLQYTLISTIVSTLVLVYSLHRNPMERQLFFAAVRYLKSKYEGHPDPTEIMKLMAQIQGPSDVPDERQPANAPSAEGSLTASQTKMLTNELQKELKAAKPPGTATPAQALAPSSSSSLSDSRSHSQSHSQSQALPSAAGNTPSYVEIEGKYYPESPDHIYVVNGRRVFYDDARDHAHTTLGKPQNTLLKMRSYFNQLSTDK